MRLDTTHRVFSCQVNLFCQVALTGCLACTYGGAVMRPVFSERYKLVHPTGTQQLAWDTCTTELVSLGLMQLCIKKGTWPLGVLRTPPARCRTATVTAWEAMMRTTVVAVARSTLECIINFQLGKCQFCFPCPISISKVPYSFWKRGRKDQR